MLFLDIEVIPSFISGLVGIILFLVGTEFIEQTIDAAQKTLDQIQIESSLSKKMFNFFLGNRMSWYSIYLGMSLTGSISLSTSIYFGYLIALQKYPDTAVGYLFLMILVPLGLLLFMIQHVKVLSRIERELDIDENKI